MLRRFYAYTLLALVVSTCSADTLQVAGQYVTTLRYTWPDFAVIDTVDEMLISTNAWPGDTIQVVVYNFVLPGSISNCSGWSLSATATPLQEGTSWMQLQVFPRIAGQEFTYTNPLEYWNQFSDSSMGDSGNVCVYSTFNPAHPEDFAYLAILLAQDVPDVTALTVVLYAFVMTQSFEVMNMTLTWATPLSASIPPQPLDLQVGACYPNPFNGSTFATVTLVRTEQLRVVVYDVLGREVTVLANSLAGPGTHHLAWHPEGEVASGFYLIRVTTSSTDQVLPGVIYQK